RELYPIVLHGVSLSIGSTDELNFQYLRNLKRLIDTIEPAWVSDHFCWTGVQGENLHDLLPLPYTQETIAHLVERIDQVQSFLKRQFVFENVSAYLSFSHSEMSEWQFLKEVAQKSGCGLLLDVNNIYVSSVNQNFDPMEFIKGIPIDQVQQIHLAGHSMADGGLIDTHDRPVIDEVWALYRQTLALTGTKPTLIEWDDQIPEFPILEAEALKAKSILQSQPWRRNDAPIIA
ncbi:MAG: MNIO family bufferin maturase, partial [Pseudobdellovibrionaceae bacterium]